ncbi:unnamed protein product [Owenia fusiformis]|uniref:Endothelin-converting enzyme 1 n=1 Tax=Owenia fusiformis TaxID=6347 RepID=A0A8S4MWD7_OWEFU|nr:unnamed protein product [Owenia fusiformis]
MKAIPLREVSSDMSSQKYKRTNFVDDEGSSEGGTPPGVTYNPEIVFKVGTSMWQDRTILERLFAILLLALTLIVVILAIILATKHDKIQQLTSKKEYCLTPACITAASALVNSMDRSVDPCEDFYQYTCGGWIKYHPMPQGYSTWGTFGVLWKQNQLVMKNEIEKPMSDMKCEAERKAKMYYESCLDKNETIQELGAQPLLNFIRDKLGGWSISDRAGPFDPSNWNFQDLLTKIHRFNHATLFAGGVGGDDKNSSRNILQVEQGGLDLQRDYYINKTIDDDKYLSAYLKYMTDIGVLLGGERNATEEHFRDVLLFEQSLAEVTTPSEERRDEEKLYHKMTVAELQEKVPFLNWLNYFNDMLLDTRVQIDQSEELVVFAPEYLGNVSMMITEMLKNDTQKRVLHTYMVWGIIKSLTSYLSKDFKDASKDLIKVFSGTTGEEEKWRTCISDTDDKLGFGLGAMFVRATFDGNSKEKATEMIGQIKRAFKANLPNLKWMDAATRKAAREKADAVIDMIGFPKFIMDPKKLDERYEKLDIAPDEYFQNNLNNMRYSFNRNMEKLRKPPDKTSWGMTPPTVNAYYTPQKNEIVFPAGILQTPFYDQNYPQSLNFGGMGVVMGHELTHGFDDQGREYDKNGNLRPWWNKESVTKFKNATKCMENQYSSYKLGDENVKGKQTLGENIADNGGLKSAYNAYMDWVSNNGEELPLPGVNLTQKQLFFMGFAQVWCTTSTAEADHETIIGDPHSPGKFRVIGTLSNSRDFSEQFNCKKDAPMNPQKKCEVW